MDAETTAIPGCVIVPLFHHVDERGEFVKVFHATSRTGDPPSGHEAIAELFWTRSGLGVVRGLHFQIPPRAHHKLVTLISGSALDIVVDLRVGSPAYGRHVAIPLSTRSPAAVAVPIGCAHGFQATSDDTVILYATSTEHVPVADRGIRWDSIGVDWPVTDVVVSERDRAFPTLDAFDSPFSFADPAPG